MRPWPAAAALILLLGWSSVAAGQAASEPVDVKAESLQLEFAPSAPAPVSWRACHPSCAAADGGSGTSIRFVGPGDGPQPRVTLVGAGTTLEPSRAAVVTSVADTPSARQVTVTSQPADGIQLLTSFEVARRGYEVTVSVRILGPNAAAFMSGRRVAVELDVGQHWPSPTASGWLTIGNDVRRCLLADGRVRLLGEGERSPIPLPAGQWAGFRDRFWTLLARADDGATIELPPGVPSGLRLLSEPGATSARYTLYSGPLDDTALGRAAPALRRLLFSGLWSWLRALSVGALWILNALIAIVGDPGVAIILLAMVVKLLLLPITTVAHRLQAQVNATQARLQPEIDAIKGAYRGEAQARRLVALYRQQGVHPLYTLKSLVGVLIQLPVFIAVFDMLAESFALNGVSFLGVTDLAQPDGLIPLPGSLPVVGGRLNVLPFIMTGVSLGASLRFDDSALPPALRRRQRRNLAALAGVFLLLFYAFPAGMVLYWTSTNALQLVGREVSRLRRRWGGRMGPVPA